MAYNGNKPHEIGSKSNLLDSDYVTYSMLKLFGDKNNLIVNGDFSIKLDGTNPDLWKSYTNSNPHLTGWIQTVRQLEIGTYTLWWDGGDPGSWDDVYSPIKFDNEVVQDYAINVPKSATNVVMLKGDYTQYSNPWLLVRRSKYVETLLCREVKGTTSIGQLAYFPTLTAPYGYLPCQGSLLNRKSYYKLWEFAQNSGNIIDEAKWSNWDSSKPNWGKFSYGDGSTTFRIPDLQGEFIRTLDFNRNVDIRSIGSFQTDAIRNLTGKFGATVYGSTLYERNCFNGVFSSNWFDSQYTKLNLGKESPTDGGPYSYPREFIIDASLQVPTANENRPRNIAYPLYIKYM